MSFQIPDDGEPEIRQIRVPARRRGRVLLPTIVVLAVLILAFGLFTSFYTDLLWFRSVSFTKVWSVTLGTKVLLFAVFGVVMALTIAVNMVVAFRTRPMYLPPSVETQSLERYRMVLEPARKLLAAALTLVVAIFSGASAAAQWEKYLLWRNASPFGSKDPQFGKDVSYYAFSYPWYRFLLGFVFAALILSLLVSVLVHYLYGGLRLQAAGDRASTAARVHLSVLLGVFVLFKAVAYWLDRYGLAVHEGSLVTGLGYTDVNAVLPAKTILTFIAIICAVLFFATIVRRSSWLLPGLGLGLLVLSSVLIGALYPALVQQFQVKPSEQDKEATFIKRNIVATRQAYDIADTKVVDYQARTTVSSGQLRNDAETIPGIRLLDPNVVSPAFKQLQQIRGFYNFPDVLDIDRYTVGGKQRDMVVAVREVDQSGIREQQQNWINQHIVYTHGFGFVGAYGNTRDSDGKPAFSVSNIPPTTGLGTFEPRIYFGEKSPAYSIVGAPKGGAARELDFPDDASANGQANNTYSGKGGIPVGNAFNKVLFAVKFQEQKILLSNLINSESKILYTREPKARVAKVAPWLKLDGDPYPALVGGRIQWIIDGYTTSNGYPYSERTTLESATSDTLTTRNAVSAQAPDQVNYIRNSVKATVDAYDGTVRLYTWDDKDPVLRTWKSAFPGTVLPRSAISADLLSHLRYPEDLFKVQRSLLARYHVQDPNAFYGGQDFWRVPKDPTLSGTSSADQPPYFLTLQMPGETKAAFSLTTTFVPGGSNKDNLTAFAAVNGNPGPNYGKKTVLVVPRNTTIPGPGQVQNNFEANTTVSSALSLLRRGGSEVIQGNLLTLPVGGGFLYVEPVYIQAAGSTAAYPLLQKVLVAFGDRIGFEDTLQAALDDVFQGDSGTSTSDSATGSGSTGTGTGSTGTGSTGTGSTGTGTTGSGTAGSPALTAALADMRTAITAADTALKAGDFAAYGKAQTALKEALNRALAAEARTGATPTPGATPKPRVTPTAAPGATPSAGA